MLTRRSLIKSAAALAAVSATGTAAPIPLDELMEVSRWSIRMQSMPISSSP